MGTFREALWEIALGQDGFVTTADAAEAGVPGNELVKLARRGGGIGRLEHVARGLYRFPELPWTESAQPLEAVLRVGPDAHLTGDAVLNFHNLALVNPRRIRVGTPHRVRAKLPPWIEVIRETLPPEHRTVYEGVPSATVAHALAACMPIVMTDRMAQAIDDAERQGLIRRRDVAPLRERLAARPWLDRR